MPTTLPLRATKPVYDTEADVTEPNAFPWWVLGYVCLAAFLLVVSSYFPIVSDDPFILAAVMGGP